MISELVLTECQCRTESLERLNKLIAHGQASSNDMQSLTRNMEALRLGNTTSCLGDEALRQIQSLLNLTDDAVLKVRQARVLEGLRFELMDERFDDIEVAHKKTFDWIFDSTAVRVAENDASTGSDVDTDDESPSETSDNSDEVLEDYSNQSEYMEDDRSWVTTSEPLNDDSEVNSIRLSRASSFVNESAPSLDQLKHKTSQTEFKDFWGDIVQFIPDSDAGDNSDSSFEWFVDEPLPVDDDQESLKSGSEESVGTSSHASSRIPAQSGTRTVSDSSWQMLAEARSSFITWLEQGNGIFHVSGKPGSGKSTLMKYLTQHPQTKEHLKVWASSKKLLLGNFFFWKPGSALQKNTKGLVRGLLHRLLSECPELIPHAFPKQWELSMHREVIRIEHDECQPAFEKIIATSHANSDHKIMVFIDGLDEFEGNHANLIRQLFQWANKSQNVKLCISSREWAIFQDAFQDCPKLRLHELTRSDIRQFVSDRFREIRIETLLDDDDGYLVHRLEETIIEESDGVFLWVSLVLRHIEEGLHNGDQLEDLMRLIKSLPTELEPSKLHFMSICILSSLFTFCRSLQVLMLVIQVLQQLSDSIPPNNQKLAYSMLSLARFCGSNDDHVFLMQYSFLEEYVENRNFAIRSAVKLFTTEENEMRLERAKRRVYGVCKGFLELRKADVPSKFSNVLGNVVHFIHRSIAEFLESPYLKGKTDLEHSNFDVFDAYCQTYLGLLKHVRLPNLYFIPDLYNTSPFFFHAPSDIGPSHLLPYPRHPSVLSDVEIEIRKSIVLGPQVDALRFCEFLDSTCYTLAELEVNVTGKHSLKLLGGHVVYCNVADIIMLVCALYGYHEFLEFLVSKLGDISSELIATWTSASVFSFVSDESEYEDQRRRACKTLQVLLNNGASPNTELAPNSGPAFHVAIKYWCCGTLMNQLDIASIAFLLYQGVNPRFAVVMSTRKYKVTGGGEKLVAFKAYFTSACPNQDSEHQVDTVRVGPADPLYYVEATPDTLDILSKYGHVIPFRTLVSIWFPDYSNVLQQVIDWIVELGVDVDAQHRLQLQSRFGPLLRPLFDPDHPNFVGRVTAQDSSWPLDKMQFVRRIK